MRFEITTSPATTPISLADAKEHLKIDHADEDDYITGLISSATNVVEAYLSRSLISQTITLYLDAWPKSGQEQHWDGVRQGSINDLYKTADSVVLPRGQVTSITSIKTFSDSDVATVMSTDNYYLQGGSISKAVIRSGKAWPIPTRVADGIEVVYVSGFGAASADVPFAIRQGLKILLSHMYANRGECGDGAVAASGAGQLLQQYRILRV